jgi:mannose-6-phosphate isomerase-like protein (cupin superfamily)
MSSSTIVRSTTHSPGRCSRTLAILTIQLRDRDIELNEGELFVVPRGVEHCPRADKEAHVLLIEPKGTTNTGDVIDALTVAEVPEI